jgi:hypothetical protein
MNPFELRAHEVKIESEVVNESNVTTYLLCIV